MKINFDSAVDALNIAFRSGKVHKTLEIAKEVYLDLDKNGKPLHLEIIGASEKLGKDFHTATFEFGNLPMRALRQKQISAIK